MKLNKIIAIAVASIAAFTASATKDDLGREFQVLAPAFSVEATKDGNLEVYLTNDGEVRGLQCDISLPEGFTPKVEDIEAAERTAAHSVQASLLDDGRVVVTVFSAEGYAITGTEGPVFTLPVTAPEELGEYGFSLSYVVLSLVDYGRLQLDDVESTVTVTPVSGLDLISAPVAVTTEGRNIVVRGAADADVVSVFNTQGVQLYRGTKRVIPMTQRGVYIVVVDGRTFKVSI